MRILLHVTVVFFGVTLACADTYQWSDEQGVVHFTDNPDILPKNTGKVRKRELPVPAATSDPNGSRDQIAASSPSPATEQRRQRTETYGGYEGVWWRNRFRSVRDEAERLTNGLPEKTRQLEKDRNRYLRDLAGGDLPGWIAEKRAKYRGMIKEIESDKQRVKQLEDELERLEVEAGKAGVPFQWRR